MTPSSPQTSPKTSPSESKSPTRRTSFGFLHRSKSKEHVRERKVSGGKISKKQHEQAREANLTPTSLPKLPDLSLSPQLQTFGGEENIPHDTAKKTTKLPMEPLTRNLPTHPSPGHSRVYPAVDRTESMTNRGRYSYAPSAVSSIDGPRRVRRRKDPTPYNVLIIGARNSGKTSFLNFLRTSLATSRRSDRPVGESEAANAGKGNRNFTYHYLETDIDGERVGLTLWDSPGLEKNVVDLQLPEMSNFIQSKFEDTFSEEMKVVRAPGARDTHIHCVFFLLDPIRLDANLEAVQQATSAEKSARRHSSPAHIIGALDEDFDLQVLRTLKGKTSVVPIISKADTITTGHMTFLKMMVREGLRKAGLNPLEALNFDADEESDYVDGIIEECDEHDDNEENARKNTDHQGSEDERGSPSTSESETVRQDQQPIPTVPRRSSARRHPGESGAFSEELPADVPDLPFSILSPDPPSLEPGNGPVGRVFPWGFADPYKPQHCDFTRLVESCFGEWRADLRKASKEIWYERWRTSRLKRQSMAVGANGSGVETKKSNGILKGALR